MTEARVRIDRATLRQAVRSGVASAIAEHRDAGRWQELAGRVERHDAFLRHAAFRGIVEDAAWVDGQLRKREAWLANVARALGLSTEEAVRRFGLRRRPL